MKCVECGIKQGESNKEILCSTCALKKSRLDDKETRLLAEYLATILVGAE